MKTHHLPGRTIRDEHGHERLYFSGTSYLGIGHNETFREMLLEGMSRYGSIYSSSRASNVQLFIYEEAESLIMQLTGAPEALTFSSGYQAGQAAIQLLNGQQNFYYAPGTHPAVWRNAANEAHGSFARWAETITQQNFKQDTVIVANSLDPLYAIAHDFRWISALPNDQDITLLVDDSHGLGVIGEHGGGIFSTLQQLAPAHVRVIVVSSLGKAFGVPGGVVLGPPDFVSTLRTSPLFTAGSPLPPAYLYAFSRSQPLYAAAREQLFTNVAYFQQQTDNLGLFRSFDRYPVFYTADSGLVAAVAHSAVLSSFPYPKPDSELITRVVLSSLHTREDLDALEGLVRGYIKATGRL